MTARRLALFGTSGFAREVDDIALELGYSTVLIAAAKSTQSVPGIEVVPEDEIDDLGDCDFAIGVGDNRVRERIAQAHSRRRFVNLIHPSASFGRNQRARVEAQRGVIVCAGVRFTNQISVGDFTIFNLNATVGHDCVIEDFVNVAPGANVSGNVIIRRGSWIGTGAQINQGSTATKLTIGAETVIGSGAVVTRDCDESSVYAGVPARKIR